MATDEELRRVAEDIRALARSLARDVYAASRAAHADSRSAADTLRDGLREAAREVRHAGAEIQRELRQELAPHRHGRRRSQQYRAAHPGPMQAPPGPVAAPVRPAPPGRCASPPVRRRWDGPVVAGLVAAVIGVAAVLRSTGLLAVPVETVLAAVLMLLGAAVVVSARTDWSLSRHIWPVLTGFALIVALFATSASYGVGAAFTHLSLGSRTVAPVASGTVYGGLGQLTVDATGARPGSEIDVRAIAGSTVIHPPRSFVFEGRVLAGQVCVEGRPSGGVGVSDDYGQPGPGVVVIVVHQLAGQIQVGTGCGGS